MIEIILDFKDIKTEEELVLYARKKLGLPYKNRVGKWDAFIDDFIDIFTKVPSKDYIYQDDDEWCWDGNYDDYKYYMDTLWEIGPKDENGNKGDIKLIFINFYQFLNEHYGIALKFLEIVLKYVNISNQENKSKCLADQWYKMVVEIRG